MTQLILNLVVFLLLLIIVNRFFAKTKVLSHSVFFALIIGLIFGTGLQLIYGVENPTLKESINWINIIGNGYVRLLQMIVMPLVFVSILSAVAKLHNSSSLGTISFSVIFLLLFTTAISATIGISVTELFHLSASGLAEGVRESTAIANLDVKASQLENLTIPSMLVSFIPRNPFMELTGANPTSIISIVIFSSLLGVAILQIGKDNKDQQQRIVDGVDSLNKIVLNLVRFVIRLTPYGILALMTKMVATSSFKDILELINFVIASYLALALMFLVHLILVLFAGVRPIQYIKKILPTLSFAFSSRSSAATLPLNIETQTEKFGVNKTIANFAASFGTTIGQNGCAGIYPAMLAVMVAPTVGIDPMSAEFILSLILVVTISSFGIAGVGGGATFAAIIVLSTMGLPIGLVGLLISIEPLIDMGRTALNVSGSIVAGILTNKTIGKKIEK